MNFAPSSLPLIIPIMPLGYPSTSRTWWNCLSIIQLYMMNVRRATSLCYAQPTNSNWRQRTSRMSTATPNYKQEVVDCLICMMTQIWFHCTCLQVLILWGSPMNSRGFRRYTIHPSDIMRNHPLYNYVSSKMLRISRMWSISWNWWWADSYWHSCCHKTWGGDVTRPDTGSWWSCTWKLCTSKNTISVSTHLKHHTNEFYVHIS